jgi:uncharacterized membrane protein
MRLTMLIFHFIGLAMGLGTGMGFMFLGRASAKMEPSEAKKFTINTLAISKMGIIGMILLVISGIYLIVPYWYSLGNNPMLILKLCLVLLLISILSINDFNIRQIRRKDPDPYLRRLKMLGPVALLTAISIVIVSVLTFL